MNQPEFSLHNFKTNIMKKRIIYLFVTLISIQLSCFAQDNQQNDDNNGDWTKQRVTLYNTPEAEMMIRAGDIDNLGFGWPDDFDPFSGNSTYVHSFPWAIDTNDVIGTDRIMVVSSYNGSLGSDGYTATTSRPENLPRPILLSYNLNEMEIKAAMLQVFVDDFQPIGFNSHYFTTINGVDAPFIATVINQLQQTGPIGKIINVTFPKNYLYYNR